MEAKDGEYLYDRKKYIPVLKELVQKGVIPYKIYKYAPVEKGLLALLINSELRFSSPVNFNDPFDCQIDDETNWDEAAIRNYFTSIEKRTGETVDIVKILEVNRTSASFKEYFSYILRNLVVLQGGVTCFSEQKDSILMWSHYANKHSGVCLGFDIREDYEFFGITRNVDYVMNYPKFDFNKDTQVPKTILYSKSKIWDYEKEVRTVMPKSGNYKFNKKCLKEVIFGCNITQDDIKLISQTISESKYSNVLLKQAKIRKHEYAMDIMDL